MFLCIRTFVSLFPLVTLTLTYCTFVTSLCFPWPPNMDGAVPFIRTLLHCPPPFPPPSWMMIPNVEELASSPAGSDPTWLSSVSFARLCCASSRRSTRLRGSGERHQPSPSPSQKAKQRQPSTAISTATATATEPQNSLSTILHRLKALLPSNRTTSISTRLLTGPHRSSALNSLRLSKQSPVHTRRSHHHKAERKKEKKGGHFGISLNRL